MGNAQAVDATATGGPAPHQPGGSRRKGRPVRTPAAGGSLTPSLPAVDGELRGSLQRLLELSGVEGQAGVLQGMARSMAGSMARSQGG